MRSSADVVRIRGSRSRRRVIIVAVIAVVVVLLLSLRSLAVLYTDSLWYSSIGQHEVFSTILETKVGLFLTFGLLFFIGLWVNLLLCNRFGPSELYLDAPEDELVRRYRSAVRPYAGRLYALLAIILSLIAASSAVGEWQQYLEFTNSKNFGIRDPLFHNDYSFYIFRLPFITFVVDWFLASIFVMLILSSIFHYLNGGIRAARVSPRVAPAVKAHLSVLLAVLAVLKAGGYLLARWHLVTSTSNGIFEGAGYTDVHARMPAFMVLFWLCLAAAVILLWNVRQRGWTLPAIAVGLWAFVALVIGVIYPAVLQKVSVTPAQSSLELPYIKRNIEATRAAYGIQNVNQTALNPSGNANPLAQPGVLASVADLREWDPTTSISQREFQIQSALYNYYQFSQLGEDRYTIDGKLTPVLIGVRELSASGIPNQTWVDQHLVYTHGIGAVMIPSNEDTMSAGGNQPVFDVKGIPPVTAAGSHFPQISEPDVYFGLDQSGYAVVDSAQKELDYQLPTGSTSYTRYKGNGGVEMGGLFRRFMFAVRFGDANLFFSNLITPNSRIMFVRNVVQMAQRAAPFLSIDAHPYAVIVGGHIDWVLDGYTTTDQYPYSQNASTQLVPSDNGLPGSYNYVRNSVKIVVDAYTGQVWLYAAPTIVGQAPDPILKAWESIFPGLIQPYNNMPTVLQQHMRYPEDLFSVQAAIYGRYHLTNPFGFYNNGSGWSLSPTDGAGSPNQTLRVSTKYDRQGYVVSSTVARMDPLYQIYALPGSSSPVFSLTDAYVSAGANASGSSVSNGSSGVLNLRGFMVAQSNATGTGTAYTYGQLTVYRPPEGTLGPVQADSKMNADKAASTQITLLNREGSKVLLGNVLMIPVDGSMLYVRPMYVTSQATSYPLLEDFIAVYNQQTGFAPTLYGAVEQAVTGMSAPPPPSTKGKTEAQLLANAQQEYTSAIAALQANPPNLGLYETDINLMYDDVVRASQLAGNHTTTTTNKK